MQKLILSLSLLIQVSIFAQVTPPTPPTPPAMVAPPEAPAPPSDEMKSDKKADTTRISLGDKEILIVNKKNKNDKVKKDDDDDDDHHADIDDDKKDDDNSDHHNHHKGIHKENMKPSHSKNKGADVGFLNLDLGVNILTNPSRDKENLELKFWSWSTTFNFLPTKIYLGSKNVRLMTSIGWRIGNYKFISPIVFEPNEILTYGIDSSIKNSKLVVHHLQIPLMIYVQSNKIKGFGRIGIGLGGYAGVKVHEKSKVSYKHIDRTVETEENFGFEKYRYGLSGRLNIGAIKLFANIDMNNSWKDKDYFKTLEAGLWFDF
ncbi:MAG: hypothetical protein ABIO44_07360 [Saprospiraceae bacterium]